ncbi:hypothetical protein [Nocardioides sp. 503]|uniref:hypothetical protein n=1 Tax=Nocardioides sp. 503 TaxID=2508326 RepID=UPI0010703F98|nr:hypothetical protein [Nocardioides sp. 503]
MPETQLVVMSEAAVEEWRAHHAAAGGSSFPDPSASDGVEVEALEVVVGDVAVGGVVLSHRADLARTTIRLLDTTLDDDDAPRWLAVLAAIESYAVTRGARSLVTAVSPRLLAPLQQAGFTVTMTGVGVTVAHGPDRRMVDDGRVRLRAMDDDERRRFVPDAREILRSGMSQAGVLAEPGAPMDTVEQRLAGLVESPPSDEVLLLASVDGVPVGRFWGTLAERDGVVDLVGNTIDLFPEHRGKGLTRPFMAALETYAREHRLRDFRGRLYGHERRARTTVVGMGAGIDDVHLRKDLDRPPA